MSRPQTKVPAGHWPRCDFCKEKINFKSPREFCRHLRDFHCTREGGSYICKYGKNNVCLSLPVDGVSDLDYEEHIMREHVNQSAEGTNSALQRLHASAHRPVSNPEPSVVQDQHKWTVFNSKVNLPAALNDPRLVKRETDFFTKTWGVDFYEKSYLPPSPYVQEISRGHFQSYINRTSERFKKHSRELQAVVEGQGPETHLTKLVRQAEKNRTELEQIPKLFLLPNFNLENPDTFNAVFPWTQVEESKINQPGTRHSSKLLQEKLSHYLDIVEVQIAQQISRRSEAFFHAMTSHDELQEKMKVTCARIKYLRDKINSMDTMMAKESLKVLKLTKSRSSYVHLHNKLKLMATVHQTQPTIQTLLSTNEFVGALDLISTTQEVLSQELAGVHSLRHLGSQLAELQKLIDIMIQEEFHKHVTSELNRPISDSTPLLDEEKLVATLFGMLRLQKFQFLDVYRDETFTGMKAVVKQTVIEAVCAADDIDTDDSNISLADQMRLLNYTQWTELMKNIFQSLLVVLERAKAFHGIVVDVLGIAAGKTKIPTPLQSPTEDRNGVLEEPKHLNVSVSDDVDVMISIDDYNKAMGGLRELLNSVCDHAHDRCVKVVAARAKDGFLERLSSSEFVALSKEVEKFVCLCEEVTGRRSMSLRGSLQSQANRFINRFHEERRTKLSLILDNERWKQADVPTEFQDLVYHISNTGQLCVPETKTEIERSPGEYLSVDGENYAVVGTVLLLLKMVIEYCQCANDIPAVSADLLTRLVDLLKIFNSRTCQLVLGAGALELVGLKTISTKNLALASRCLQLVVHYMPMVRKHFEDKLVNNKSINMLKHFDQILKDHQDHIDEISNKLVTIMESMVDSQLSRWEVKAPMPSSCFRAICKQMAKLHEAIIDILPQEQVKAIFSRINQTFKKVLRQHLIHLNVTNNGGPQHGLILDNERWKQADVPTEFQDLVYHISNTGQLCVPETKTEIERSPGEYLSVDGENYAVVGTVLLLLKMVIEYCQCANDIPAVSADLLTRLVDLLKIFNSRTCQLVLGAGALELVGLKTISTKNLALASRCLQLVVHYMPMVRKHFEDKLVNNKSINMLKHFDQILKDHQDHIDEISNKLVTIMESMVDSQLSRWEVKAPMPSSCFRAICKQMAKLHEAIIDILPQEQVKAIFSRINQTFKKVLRQQLIHLNVTNNGGPQHGLVTSDLTFYAGSFKTLRGLEDLAQDVNDVWDKR